MGLEQSNNRLVPRMAVFHGWYTGDAGRHNYWQPFVDFLDEVTAQGGQLITTQELGGLCADWTGSATTMRNMESTQKPLPTRR